MMKSQVRLIQFMAFIRCLGGECFVAVNTMTVLNALHNVDSVEGSLNYECCQLVMLLLCMIMTIVT